MRRNCTRLVTMLLVGLMTAALVLAQTNLNKDQGIKPSDASGLVSKAEGTDHQTFIVQAVVPHSPATDEGLAALRIANKSVVKEEISDDWR